MISLSENMKWFPLKKCKKFEIYTYFQKFDLLWG